MPNKNLKPKKTLAERNEPLKADTMTKLKNLAKRMGFESYEDMFSNKTSSHIQSFVENFDLSVGWKEAQYYAVCAYYASKGEQKFAEKFGKLGKEKRIEREDEYAKGQKSEKREEDWIEFDVLCGMRDALKDYKNEKEMYQYLILSMITYQAPLRPCAWKNMKLIRTLADLDKKSKDFNYLYISRRSKVHGFYWINTDKVSNTFTHYDNKQLVLSSEFANVVNDSLEKYPRTMLFDFDVKNVDDKVLSYLQQVTKNKFNFSLARSVYITYNLHPDAPYAQREQLAKLMRHTVETQQKKYRIAGVNPIVLQHDELLVQLKEKDNEIGRLKMEIEKIHESFNPMMAYYKKRRYDLIFSANKDKTTIKPQNLALFNITYDDKTELYA
jgi:hypothetical protein